MKKIFALLLSLVLIFSLCACGAKEEAPAAAPAAPAAPAEEAAPAAEEAPAEEAPVEEAPKKKKKKAPRPTLTEEEMAALIVKAMYGTADEAAPRQEANGTALEQEPVPGD